MAEAVRRLAGRTAIVTGAGSGIGEGIANRMWDEGANVLRLDLGFGPAATAAGSDDDAARWVAMRADVTSEESMRTAAEEAVGRFGTVDIAVACAGISAAGTAVATDVEDWQRVIAVNLTGTWLTARAVIPVMAAQGKGSIVNVASASALVGMRAVAAYSAAKAGVVGLTRQMAADYARDGIRVNAISPGLTRTPMLERMYEDVASLAGGGKSVGRRIDDDLRGYPLRRLGEVSDIAGAACFLGSDEADWITGIVLPVDGGYTAT